MPRVYATRADLANYAPPTYTVPSEPEATRVLTRASLRLDNTALKTAVYDVDDTTGLPTDVDVITAIRDATCAQVVWWADTGSESGAADLYSDVSIGSARLSRGSGTAGTPVVAPAAWDHLSGLEGLTLGVVTTYGAGWG